MTESSKRSTAARAARAFLAAAMLALAAAPSFAADANSALVDEARLKARKRDVRGALQTLDKAISADPMNAEAHILYEDLGRDVFGVDALIANYRQRAEKKPDEPLFAFLHARILAPDAALAAFDKQVKQFPQSPWPHVGRARALELSGRAAEAGPEYDAAVAVAPADIRFKVFQAYGLEKAQLWSPALDAWRVVLSRLPNDRGARLGLAEALRKCTAYDEALAALNEVLKTDPNDSEALFRVGLVQMDAGKPDEALKSLDAAIAGDKMFTEAYCVATEVSIRSAIAAAARDKRDPVEKDFDRALNYGGKAAAVAADKAEAHFALGAAHEAAGESNPTHYDAAAMEYDAALNLLPMPGPDKLRATCAKAYVLLRQQKWDQALAMADKALGMDPSCAAAYAHAGEALSAQDRQDEAIKKYYRPGLKACPSDARLHHALGVALWETRHEQDAKKALETAVKLDGDNARFRMTLGELYFELRSFPKAAEMLAKVVDARPWDEETWRSYGRVCCAVGDWDQAVESYEKICAILEAPKPAAAPAAPPPGGQPPANPPAAEPPADSGGADPDGLLAKAHYYLAIIYLEHKKVRDKAQAHLKKFLALGGSDPDHQQWIDDLLKDQ